MNQSRKVFLGILSLTPIVLQGIIISSVFGMVFEIASNSPYLPGTDDSLLFQSMFFLIMIGGVTALITLGLIIYYIMHVVNNKSLASNVQTIWVILFIFTGSIAIIIYWYLNIWKGKS